MRIFSIALLLGTLFIGFDVQQAQAELATSASCRYRVSRTTGRRLDGIRHRFTVTLNQTLGLGETCTVTHNACGSAFIPSSQAPTSDNRDCIEFKSIGSSTLGAGDSQVTARSRSRVMQESKRSGRGKQITYGVDVTCTDGTNTTAFACAPKARKASVNGADGARIDRVINKMRDNFS